MYIQKRWGLLVFLLLVPLVAAEDSYKPYLHKAEVPEAPKVGLKGSYQTNLFPGDGTYSYQIDVPPGTNGLQPSLALSYSAQAVKSQSVLGAGWNFPGNYIFRDINHTLTNSSDDMFILMLNGVTYDLVFDNSDSFYHTETETFARIENVSTSSNEKGMYWLVTLKDGTRLQFGYNSDAELVSNLNSDIAVKWSLDTIQDVYSNSIFYSYFEDPYQDDNGTAYLRNITYNNDKKRKIEFEYEGTNRPDRRISNRHGVLSDMTRRLSNIYISFNSSLIRRYSFDYVSLSPSMTSLKSITYIGSDNASELHTASFSYERPIPGYTNETNSSTYYNFSLDFVDSSGNDQGVRLTDLNNDGYIDLLYSSAYSSQKIAKLNTKSGWIDTNEFVPPEYFVSSDFKDQGYRIVDLNSDGYPDIIRGYGSITKAWLNNKSGFVEDSITWGLPSTQMSFLDGSGSDLGVRLSDVNGDSRVDLIRSSNISHIPDAVFLNTGYGWKNVSNLWEIPEYFTYDYYDKGVRLLDLNGDGLTDIVRGVHSHSGPDRFAWLNNGSGWSPFSEYSPPIRLVSGGLSDLGVRFVDLNQDGLPDILYDLLNTTTADNAAWLNTGRGWQQNNSWSSVEPFSNYGKNVGVRLGDVNGDGFSDILVGRSNDNYVLVQNFSLPFLLNEITHEFGGTTELAYAQSTGFNNTDTNGDSQLGFNVWVVDTVLTDNGLSGEFLVSSNTTYRYKFGLYNQTDFEFRGFGKVNETLTDNSTVSHFFDQSRYLKGKEVRTEIYDSSDTLFLVTENEYNVTKAFEDNGVIAISHLEEMTNKQYDGSDDPLTTSTSYSYDSYGNVVSKIQHGLSGVTGDEKYERYEFVYNVSAWIIDKVSRYQLFDSDNATKLRETRYFYDNSLDSVSKGSLTKQEDYLDTGTGNPVVTYTYDLYGNPYRQTDALGHTIAFYYGTRDDTHTYPDRRLNELGHAVDYEYDIGTGNVLSTTRHGVTFSNQYDVFGRIIDEILPYDSAVSPSKEYSYDFDGVAPEKIVVTQKTSANESLDTVYFYDGFGNLVQIKTPAEEGQVVKNIFYDGLFRVTKEQNPYFDSFSESLATPSTTKNKTFYHYDALGRVVFVVNSDGTTKSTVFSKDVIHDYDENGNHKTYYLDGFDRIIAVEEHNTDFYLGENESYNTTYSYNGVDELVGIKDYHGNMFNFTYNSLGQKVQLDDPDLGVWQYGYDFAGNLISQRDNKDNEILIGYDGLNRITHKNTSSVNFTFTYDVQYQGTLSAINFSNVTYSYTYDDRLRPINEIRVVRGLTLEKAFSYDSMDRILEILQPNGNDIEYYYGAQGRVDEIKGWVNSSNYNAFGNPLNRSYFNDKITSFTYDSQNARLTQIKTGSDQELNYGYDSVGNIVSIDDNVNSRVYRMSYDNLDRLTNVSINEYKWVYNFDAIGNILKIVRNFSTTTSFKMDGSLAHAPQQVVVTETGADVYKAKDVNTSSKSKITQFYLVNEKNTALTNANWVASFGDGNVVNSTESFNLGKDEDTLVILEHTYSSGGDYDVNLSGKVGSSLNDYETLDLLFGALANDLAVLKKNASIVVTEFSAMNDLDVQSNNWEWECDNGVSSTELFSMDAHQELLIVMEHNYSLSDNSVECLVNSSDGNQSVSQSLSFDGIEIENYNSTLQGDSGIEVKFEIKNYYSTQDVSWNITVDDQIASSSAPVTLEQGESVTVIQGFNFTERGVKPVRITVYSDDFIDTYAQNSRLYSLDIKDFLNIVKDGTTRIFNFVISNTWTDLTAYWNVSDPSVENTVDLAQNSSLIVVIEEEFSQGRKEVEIQLYNQTKLEDKITEIFIIKEIEIAEFETTGGDKTSVSVAKVTNNVENKNISWTLDTSEEIINSGSDIELQEDQSAFVVVESSYSESGVYPVNLRINSSGSNDNQTGVAQS